eukprot:scaffold4144_cov133-Isochrysis_galbana.AAC.2
MSRTRFTPPKGVWEGPPRTGLPTRLYPLKREGDWSPGGAQVALEVPVGASLRHIETRICGVMPV